MLASISNTPATVKMAKPVSVAWMMGASDAEAGELCLPELYFVRREHKMAYVGGHESVVGETMLSCQCKNLPGA